MEGYDEYLRKRLESITKDTPRDGIPKKMDTVQTRSGLSWKKLAEGFCKAAIKKMAKDGVDYLVFSERLMREMVGNPNNYAFKKYCVEYGFKLSKDKWTKAFTVSKINRAENERK